MSEQGNISPVTLRGLIIIPAFNERGGIGILVGRIKRAIPEFDILVIDDGSTDDTIRQVPVGAVVVSLPFNLGIGGAMQTGYRYAAKHDYDVAIQVDADGQHRPREVRRLVNHLAASGADMVVGSRFLGVGQYRQLLGRKVGAWILRVLLKCLVGQDFTDCTSGFRVVNKRAIRAFAHWYPDDYPEPEIILLMKRAGFAIVELPVTMRQRRFGKSSISDLKGLFYVLKVSCCLLLGMMRNPWLNRKVRME